MIRVGIAGASGYTGIELIRLLASHPEVSISRLYSKSQVGISISQIYPHLKGIVDLTLDPLELSYLTDIDVLFLALPHGQAQHHYDLLKSIPAKIIDLSADFRLNNPVDYLTYYGEAHTRPELLGTIPLGLPELYSAQMKSADYVACPGCYATSVMLGVSPLSHAGLVHDTIIADSKSGVSGAGKSLKESSLYCEANESFSAYGTHSHRHLPEMEMVTEAKILFSPHLVPMSRGILSTLYIPLAKPLSEADITTIYSQFYATAPFVQVRPGLKMPSTKYAAGTNHCVISWKLCPDIQKVVVFSALDNLIKGASGQAIQCMNLMMDLPEIMGLPQIAPYL
jgi:N-acetyl-gamma-glutamyl-phosphate reductase